MRWRCLYSVYSASAHASWQAMFAWSPEFPLQDVDKGLSFMMSALKENVKKLDAIGNLAPKRFMIDAYSVEGMVVCAR